MATDNPNPAETLALAGELERWPWAGQLEPKMSRLFRGVRAMAEELAQIDEVLARRPALDLPTRWQNIEKAINPAKRAASAEAERDALKAKLIAGDTHEQRRASELAEAKSDSERLRKELTAAEADVASLQRVIAGAIEADRAAQGGQGK